MSLSQIILDKPYLAWYVKDKKDLSVDSTLEHVLNFGNWEDYLKVEENLGIKATRKLFNKIANKKRTNLRPQTVNYFKLYFQKYA